MRAFFDELTAFLTAFEFWAIISGTFSAVYHVVAGPLVCGRESGWASKEIFIVYVGDGKSADTKRGRASPKKTRVFDSTKGFPGEDVAVQLQYYSRA